MKSRLRNAPIIPLIFLAIALLLMGCENPTTDDEPGNTGTENDETEGDETEGDETGQPDNDDEEVGFFVITEDNMETLKEDVVKLMSDSQASMFATRDELNPIFLPTVLRDHLDDMESYTTDDDLTSDLCESEGSVSLESSGDSSTFTYNQCSSPDDFDTSNPFVRDGTIQFTDNSDHYFVEIDLEFRSTQHEGSVEFTYTSDADYVLNNLNVTRTPKSEISNIVQLEDMNISYRVAAEDISIAGIYGERTQYDGAPAEETGKIEISSDDLNKLHDTSRGTVTLQGADNTGATIDFSTGSAVIELDS